MNKEIFIFKISRLYFIPFYFLIFLILFFNFLFNFNFKIIFIVFLIILLLEIYRFAFSFLIYEDKIIKRFKFIIVNEIIVYYDKIQDIKLSQNIFERIFNLGKIFINTAGSDNVELIIEGVYDPKSVKEKIELLKNNFLNKKYEK